MDRSRRETHARRTLIVCAGALALAALVAIAGEAPSVSEADPPGGQAEAAVSPKVIPPGVGGLKTYRDPVTGERRSPPRAIPLEALDARQRNAFSRSDAGLVEEPGPSAAGGVHVDLQGRFRSAVVITRQPDGSFSTRCLDELPRAMRGQ